MRKKLFGLAVAGGALMALSFGPSAAADEPDCDGVAAEGAHLVEETLEGAGVPDPGIHGRECDAAKYDPTSSSFNPLP